jgi:hypothetical protein
LTSRASVAGKVAARVAPGAVAIVPAEPLTSKSAAVPRSRYEPPVAALPQAFETVRENWSAA